MQESRLYTVDRYFVKEYTDNSICVAGKRITPKLLAEALRTLPEEKRNAVLSVRKYRDERGNTYFGIDEDIRDRLRSRLIRAVLDFEAVTARYVDVRLERKKEILDAYHDAVGKTEPPKAECWLSRQLPIC